MRKLFQNFTFKSCRPLLVLTMTLCFSIYAQAPSTGRLPKIGDGNELGLIQERRIGEMVVRSIYRDPDYLDDPVLMDYVQDFWTQLRQAARVRGEITTEIDERFAWEVMLIRDKSINAFALPGGFMGVNLGLIASVSTGDELASVMAHELSHVTQRHIARMFSQQERNSPLLMGAILLGLLAMGRAPEAASALIVGGQAVGVQTQLNFSRDMEREADRVGYGVLTQAGYEPRGFVGMFEKLQAAARFNDRGNYPYLRSHPLTTERISDMQARLQLLPEHSLSAPAYIHAMMAARAKVLANTQFDALKNFQEEVIALNAQTTVIKRVSTLYAGALAESLHNNATAAQRHIEALRQIKELDNQSKYVLQLLDAEVKIKSAQFTQAVALIQPLSDSRAKQLMLAQARLGTQQKHIIKESVDDLVMWLANHPRDAGAWSWLSQATKLQGDELRSVRSDAESRAFQYDEIGAIDRLKAAQDLSRKMSREGKLDRSGQIESAIIDSRLRELEVARKELLLQK